MTAATGYVDSDNNIHYDDAVDSDGTPITTGTIVVTIYNTDGEEVSGESWPVSLTHQSGGDWKATIRPSLQYNKAYLAKYVINAGGLKRTHRLSIVGGG